MFRRTADFVCRSSVFPRGHFVRREICATKIVPIFSDVGFTKKQGRGRRAFSEEASFSVCAHKKWARHPPRHFGRGKVFRMRTKKMGAYAAPLGMLEFYPHGHCIKIGRGICRAFSEEGGFSVCAHKKWARTPRLFGRGRFLRMRT